MAGSCAYHPLRPSVGEDARGWRLCASCCTERGAMTDVELGERMVRLLGEDDDS
jgi:hypothetical protein